MSAFPDQPDHFLQWLEQRSLNAAPTAFVQRLTYGQYLTDLLDTARQHAPGRLDIVDGDVRSLGQTRAGIEVHIATGGMIKADAAVLAVGNLPPHDPPGLDPATLPTDRYKGDPWQSDATRDLAEGDTVLLIGSGLTMVDVALTLDTNGFRGNIVALSRRGLLPQAHASLDPNPDKRTERPDTILSSLVHDLRTRTKTVGWRNAVDELRPFTQAMWANASSEERARFLRHLRPWWDVHRHRLAPQVADRLRAMQAAGRLQVMSGKTCAFEAHPHAIAVTWRPRGSDVLKRLLTQRVINCTGPQGNLAKSSEPLLRALAAQGAIRPDGAVLGLDVSAGAAVINETGVTSDRLFAVGPITRGAFWEIVAVPDIRVQAWSLARRLSNAHWIEGEGL